MSSVHDAFVGVAEEVTYGTAVAPSRFYEFVSEGLKGVYERVESEGVRAGTKVLRSDRFVPVAKGAEGDLKLEVFDAGFGLLLKHMLGAVSTTGAGPYVHTATVGDLAGKALTVQAARAAVDGTLHPFTYEGGKVKEWELSNAVDGVLSLSLDMDFEKETIGAGAGAYALATPTYPADAKLLTFVGGVVQIAGADFAVTDASVKGSNGLKVDRFFLGNSKKEPREEGLREYGFELKGEFESLAHIQRVASATAAGAVATVTLTWASPTAGNELAVTIEAGRFDEGAVNAEGATLIEQTLSGKALFDGTNSPVTIAYTSGDASA